MFKSIALAVMLLLSPVVAYAESSLKNSVVEIDPSFLDATVSTLKVSGDYGGSVMAYIQKYNLFRELEVEIQITDYCLSACTFVLGLVPKGKVCVTPHTIFGFHSARDGLGIFHREATRMMWQLYPTPVQERLISMGWDGEGELEHPDFLYMKGTELYDLCGAPAE